MIQVDGKLLLRAGLAAISPSPSVAAVTAVVPIANPEPPVTPAKASRNEVSETVGDSRFTTIFGMKPVRVPMERQKQVYYEWNKGCARTEASWIDDPEERTGCPSD
jgi:hypothetical protein